MSLWRRVVLGCLAVAIVLVAADIALASTFRGFLLDRVDQQLVEASHRFSDFAAGPRRGPGGGPGGGPPGPGPGGEPLSEFYIGVADTSGAGLTRLGSPLRAEEAPPVLQPEQIVAASTQAGAAPITAGDWRVVAVHSPADNAIFVVGSSLATIAPTYQRMVFVLLVATAAVFATLTLVAWWVLRQGVRPLAAMTSTAEEIAGDALHARVAETDERTEAGRLGSALNTMLERIQAAFGEREESERRLRRFVADASHELRTPLTSIRGYAELYRAGGLTDEAELANAMRRVEQEGERMGDLVEDLLLLAKLDQGRPLERVHVDLAPLVRDAVTDLHAVQPQRPVNVVTEPVHVLADDHKLRQAVGNLLTNAREHTSASTPVHVRVRAEGTEAVVEVTDEGPGMPADVTDRVFERFFRADPARARTSGGSGLGLSIVASIAAAHGGTVAVRSEAGQGSSFLLRLPRVDAPAPTPEPLPPAHAPTLASGEGTSSSAG